MTGSRPKQRLSLAPLVFTLLGLLGLGVLTYIARTPGPTQDPSILHMEVMHNSMLPSRVDAGVFSAPPTQPPQLLSASDSQLEAQMTSWAYAYGRHRITVHRLDKAIKLPENLQVLGLDGQKVVVFESKDLTFLTWKGEGKQTYFVVGSAPVDRLDELGRWFRTRSVPQSTDAPGAEQKQH
jgi:hypothetical protein